MVAESTFRDAVSMLLERRRSQRGFPTLGDEADRALLAALTALPPHASGTARRAGVRLGTHVYSRRYHEDTLASGVATLSRALAESGVGWLTLRESFHRVADLGFEPHPRVAATDAPVLSAFMEGVLEGFLSTAFNCEAKARAEGPNALRIELGEGRDVNQQGAHA